MRSLQVAFIRGATKHTPMSRKRILVGLAIAGAGIGVLALSLWSSDFPTAAIACGAILIGGMEVLEGLPSGEPNPHYDAMMAWRSSEAAGERLTAGRQAHDSKAVDA